MKLSRKLIFPLFLLFLLFGGSSLIFDLIYKYPVEYVFDKIVWNIPVRIVFFCFAILLVLKQCKWIKNAYVMTFNQWLAYGFVMILFVLARLGDDWEFLRIDVDKKLVAWQWHTFFEQSREYGKWYSGIFQIKLIDILWLSLLYPLSVIFRKTYNWISLWFEQFSLTRAYQFISKKYNVNVESLRDINSKIKGDFFEEDIPIKVTKAKYISSNIESQQYKELTDLLVSKLKHQKFKKAFSIGIIGLYGNGKSSFVNHLRDEFENQLSSKRFEVIEFLPAYSYKPEQISTDFFTILASRLKKYHGSLNQSMLAYAAKLLELGINGKKDIQGLLKPADWFTENKSASQAYEDLKDIFTQIDIKTIVIIDDVDRLGKDEIFEVLRIIRNTANFPNTIFIVAYDKDYVVDTIKKDIMYLDKYFQYELFVPPHRSEDLLSAFAKMVLSKETGVDIEKLKEVINIETLNKTLLDRFVFNYRDVKVLINIYCTNLCLLTEEVDYIDLLHFTLMNRHFPKQVRYIYNNFDEFFDKPETVVQSKGFVKVLELMKCDSLRVPITVDSFIADLDIKNDSQRILFKKLFLELFGIKDDTALVASSVETTDKEKQIERMKMLQNIPYSPNMEFSIRNADRTHIYFELILTKDDISNVEFSLQISGNEFQDYIQGLLKNLDGQKKVDFKVKIKAKLEFYHAKLNSKIKIENAIKGAPLVGGDLTQILFHQVQAYKSLPKELFKDKKDFIDFFKEKLWNNENLEAKYIIETILQLERYIREVKEEERDDKYRVPRYIGLTEEEVNVVLINKTNQVIQECENVDYIFLVWLSGIFDSPFNITDADINFSKYLYDNKDRLFEYLKIVEKFYNEEFKFSSAIFKVFTDKDQFKEECFGIKEEKILIREFHHLLELHSWRKDKVDGFIPFYFDDRKDLKNSLLKPVKQTIYVDFKKGGFNTNITKIKNSGNIETFKITDSIYLVEGKHSYLTLIKEGLPNFNYPNIVAYLKANQANFEILSIQTDEQIDPSIIQGKRISFH